MEEDKQRIPLNLRDIDRIVEMAWEDRTPFEAITFQFNVSEKEVIEIMRREMKPSSFRMWRKRVQGRSTKHRFELKLSAPPSLLLFLPFRERFY